MFEKNEDYEKNLQLTATFSNNRNLLFKQIHMQKESNGSTNAMHLVHKDQKSEEKLDSGSTIIVTEESAKDLNDETPETVNLEDNEPFNISKNEAIDEIEPNVKVENEAVDEIEMEKDILPDDPNYFDENDSDTEVEDITEEMEFEYDLNKNPTKDQQLEEEYENVISIEELFELDSTIKVIPKMENKKDILNELVEHKSKEDKSRNNKSDKKKEKLPTKKKTLPTPKSAFGSWVEKFQEPGIDEKTDKKKGIKKRKKKLKNIDTVSKKQKKKKHSKKGKKTVSFAEQSLRENKEIVSETLAHILASQGSYEKGIEMFKKLGLIFPEKSSYFAAQIKKLKK